MAEELKVEGLAELANTLSELGKRIEGRVLQTSLRRGAALMVTEAKARAPILKNPDSRRRPGALRANVRARPVRDPEHSATVIVGVRKLSVKQVAAFKKKTGRKGSDNPSDPFYWRFLEFGTARMPARPFLRPAFEVKKIEAVDVIRSAIAERIELEVGKLVKK